MQREYNKAHGFTPVAAQPSKVGEVRNRGRNLNAEMSRDARAKTVVSASVVSADKLKYNTPAKNLRAAQAAAAELPSLSGEVLRRQQARVNELIEIANKQNEEYLWANPGAGASQVVHSTRGAGGKSFEQASSPHVSRGREGSINSGKNKQMQTYDPAFAEKQNAGQGSAG